MKKKEEIKLVNWTYREVTLYTVDAVNTVDAMWYMDFSSSSTDAAGNPLLSWM